MKTIIIGGGACGASAAARLRRLNDNCQITILEKSSEVSIANCGLPYYCSGIINEREKIIISTPEKLKKNLNIEVRLNSEVVQIHREEKQVELQSGERLPYDKLILAQGASPIRPPFEGGDNPKIFTLRNLNDADQIKNYIQEHHARDAIVIGGGFIGVEMAENLAHMGLQTKLIELQNQILAPIDEEIAVFAQNAMRSEGIELILSDGVASFSDEEILLSSGRKIKYDIAIMAIGVRPEIELAQSCGLAVERGIRVNKHMQCSDEDIYAGGDSVEVTHFVTQRESLIPLAGPANRQGRIIADHIAGYDSSYKKSQATSILKVLDYSIACVGINEKKAIEEKIEYLKTFIFGPSHASYYPGATDILIKLLFTSEGYILGAQAVGQEGVDKRIDIIASVMRNGGTTQDLLDAELCYAPPYSSAKDPINILGMNAENILKGLVKPAFFEDLNESILIDVRPAAIYALGSIDPALNIPLDELRERIDEVPRDKKVILFCNTGFTSYLASRILLQQDLTEVYSLMGGMKLYKEIIKNKQGSPMKKVATTSPKLPEKAAAVGESIKIDTCGLQCPGPIMRVASSINDMQHGQRLDVSSTDLGFASDIEAWCESTSNTLLSLSKEGKIITASIQKGHSEKAAPPLSTHSSPTGNNQTIVVFSNDLDKAIAAFIIANGACAAGKKVTLFFTFWGLNILRKSNISVKKSLIDSMFGWMMPKGVKKLTLSKMNMGGLGTCMMKWVMKNKNAASLQELMDDAQSQGVKFIACNMSMDIMGIQQEELIEGIEIGGVAKYINESNKANSNLFI